jgi:ubiquitin C-terminal hydrolase
LFAISNHFGGTGGGHYTAYAQNWKTKKWYNFDDSSCSETRKDNVITKAAYNLFFRRRDYVDLNNIDYNKFRSEKEDTPML